jgi:polysaccharide export outer membrane protein
MRSQHNAAMKIPALAESRTAVLFPVLVILTFMFAPLCGTDAFAQVTEEAISPQDVLTVTVWNQPALSGKFNVEPDGTFLFPLVGRITAGGLDARTVEDRLKDLLGKGYVKSPQLSIAVDRRRAPTVFVMGEVRQPGSYPLNPGTRLIEILARAGSTTDRAGTVAVITRAASSGAAADAPPPEVIRTNLQALQASATSENVLLRDGDTIFVPRAPTVYIVGEVKSPGMYAMPEQLTVLQAIALAGGFTDRGSSKHLRVVRQSNGFAIELKVISRDVLRPGDTVVVGERLF